MKKIYCILIILILFSDIMVFAESNFSNTIVGVGLYNSFVPPMNNDEWTVRPGWQIGGRFYIKQLNDKFDLGFAFSIYMPFVGVDNVDWKMPSGTEFNFNENFGSIFDIGTTLGGSLIGEITDSLLFFIDLSLLFNYTGATRDLGYYLFYGNVKQQYQVSDIGVSINPGLLYNFGMVSLEIGMHLKFYFVKQYTYQLFSEYNQYMLDKYRFSSNESNIQFKGRPYILIGLNLSDLL